MILLMTWRNLRYRPFQTLASLGAVLASVAMAVLVTLLASGIHQGLILAAEPFDLVVGAKGSPNQLVLNVLFLQDTPIGNIERSVLDDLRKDARVISAIPLGFGDNYRGFRLVGTDEKIFQHRVAPHRPPWLRIREGRSFHAPFEAVIGSQTALLTGLKIGSQFSSSHGVVSAGESHGHPQSYTVVGILDSLRSPYDSAILVSLESILQAHRHGEEPSGEPYGGAQEKSLTALMVKPKGYSEALQLYAQFQQDDRCQMIFPSQVVVRLFSILGQGEQLLRSISWAVMAMAMMIVAFSLYWSAQSRRREQAVLRALGASHGDLFLLSWLEGHILVVAGVALGAAAGHGLFALIASALRQKTAVALTSGFSISEGAALLVLILLGSVVSLCPAFLGSRRDVAENL